MDEKIVSVFYSRWEEELQRPASMRDLFGLYKYAIWYKANPRDSEYMKALVAEKYPAADWVDASLVADWVGQIALADRILLLYPDAIGLGMISLELKVRRVKKNWTDVVVLNGRRREFRLSSGAWFGLCLRRLFEWSMLPELIFLPLFVVVTPVLWVFDWARGRA